MKFGKLLKAELQKIYGERVSESEELRMFLNDSTFASRQL